MHVYTCCQAATKLELWFTANNFLSVIFFLLCFLSFFFYKHISYFFGQKYFYKLKVSFSLGWHFFFITNQTGSDWNDLKKKEKKKKRRSCGLGPDIHSLCLFSPAVTNCGWDLKISEGLSFHRASRSSVVICRKCSAAC